MTHQIIRFFVRHERAFVALSFFTGFIWDSLTLWNPNGVFEHVTFITYLLITTSCIVLLHILDTSKTSVRAFVQFLMQFGFGNLAGGFFVLYGRSGTVEGSIIFFLLLALVMILNEVWKNRYSRQSMQIAVWYILLSIYCILAVPIYVGSLDVRVFWESIILSFVVGCTFIILLFVSKMYVAWRLITVSLIVKYTARPLLTIASITVIVAFLYQYNIIPPVPLALRNAGIYYSAQKVGDTYILKHPERRVSTDIPFISDIIESAPSTFVAPLPERLYCFSSVFIPVGIDTTITHVWESFNPDTESWEILDAISYNIGGGRDAGYRGYTILTAYTEGRYRCSVQNAHGSLIGRRTVHVKNGELPVLVIEEK